VARGRWLILEPTKIERLIALLNAQRGEAAQRAREVRGSRRWIDSSNRLDALNDRIMHDTTFELVPEEPGPSNPASARSRRPPRTH
jgi:hypothetical protein